jgi:flagellar basal-body rod modification protein FlgD
MKYQDPLNPMDGQQMAAQLAQFSSVEQLLNIGKTLESQTAAQSTLANLVAGSSALSAVGKTATASSDVFEVTSSGRLPERVVAQIPATARTATLVLYDQNGQTVKSQSVGAVAAGRQTLDVGRFADGVGTGIYRLAVEVTDAGGAVTDAPAAFSGRVDGVRYTPTGPVVTIGGVAVPFTGVTEVGG